MAQDSPGRAAPKTRRHFLAFSWVVLAGSLLFTGVAAYYLGRGVEEQDKLRFENLVQRTESGIAARMSTYLAVLRSAAALFAASDAVDPEEFRTFVEQVEVQSRYPGIQGIGFTRRVPAQERSAYVEAIRQWRPGFHVWPEDPRPEYFAIEYLEPLDRRNRAALGYDMFTEPTRRAAMARARDTGLPAVTGRVTLVQEIDPEKQAGFLIYVPVYRAGQPLHTVEERRRALAGLVYAPFRADDLLRGIFTDPDPQVSYRVYAAPRPDERALLHESIPIPRDEIPRFRASVPVRVSGATWDIDFATLDAFEAGSGRRLVGVLGFTGILLSLMLFALARNQVQARFDAERAAEDLARSQQYVRHRERELQLVLDRMPIGCLLTGPDLRLTYVNPAAERIFGHGAAALRDLPLEELVLAPVARREMRREHERLAAGEALGPAIYESRTRDGQPLLCEWHETVLRAPDGAVTGVIAMVQDITQRRSLEEQLRQSQKLEAVGRLAGGVAHDFNNILTATMGYSDLLLEEFAPDDPRRMLGEEIRRSGERATTLVRQLLAFGRRQVLDPRVLDLNHVVAEIDRMLRRLIGEDVEMRVVPAVGLGRVRADQGQVEQIIVNLVVNARDAMPQGGRLVIETGNVELDENYARRNPDVTPGPYVMLAVSDNGTGMDAETQSHIFEPFFTTKQQGKGTGLGLSMVYGIVKQSGGHVSVYSEVGHGTTFKTYFPCVDAPVEPPPPPRERELPPGYETVLVVEDDAAVRSYMRQVLERCNYTVIEAGNAAEALASAGAHPQIDALITDIVMPGMGGRELADNLTARLPDLRVLFVSGYTEDAVLNQGKLAPGMAFLAKPFTPRALAGRLREVLDRERVNR